MIVSHGRSYFSGFAMGGLLLNQKRTERLMLQRFLNTFGSPENVVIAFGDWEQKKQMKYKEPTKGKGMRKLFREFGYLVYLVDEFRSSCKCYNCKSAEPETGYCEKFRYCENPRPWKAGEQVLRHGLVKCKTCHCLWNRDVLSSLNMEAIGSCAKQGIPRPAYLARGDPTLYQGCYIGTLQSNLTQV